MSDLISRQAAIDAALKFIVEYCGAAFDEDMQKMLCERIDALPSAEPHWIPCSERLPACFEPVITWDGHCYSVEKRIPYIRDKDGDPIKGEWWVSDDYDELEETDYYPNLRDGAAIAWMPLPKPYEGDKE